MNKAKNRVRYYILAISLFTFYSITCKAQKSAIKKVYAVDVASGVKITSLNIRAGNRVHIVPLGKINLNGITDPVGPEGIDNYSSHCMDPVFPYGALLYKIGDDDWNMADPEDTIVEDRSGVLKFMINDNDPSNDRGKFIVNVTVNSGKIVKINPPNIPAKKVDTTKIQAKNIPAKNIPAKKTQTQNSRTKKVDAAKIQAKNIPPKKVDAPKVNVPKIDVPKNIQTNVPSHLPAGTAGTLSLPDLQKAITCNFKEAKSFLLSKQFRFNTASSSQMNMYSYLKDNLNVSVTKDESQIRLQTSSLENYDEINASLAKFGYTPLKVAQKIEGVTGYANSQYSIIIGELKFNNKSQYFFIIRKLSSFDKTR